MADRNYPCCRGPPATDGFIVLVLGANVPGKPRVEFCRDVAADRYKGFSSSYKLINDIVYGSYCHSICESSWPLFSEERLPLAALPENSSKTRKAVLVVDDEPNVRFLITEVLDDLAYASLEAADGPSALDILQSDVPIDLMITDLGLPGGMDGRQLASAARAERPGLAILFITGYGETAAPDDLTLASAILLLAKPFSIDALTSFIKRLTAA